MVYSVFVAIYVSGHDASTTPDNCADADIDDDQDATIDVPQSGLDYANVAPNSLYRNADRAPSCVPDSAISLGSPKHSTDLSNYL